LDIFKSVFQEQYGALLTALRLPDKIMMTLGIYGDRLGAASHFPCLD